MTHRVAIWLLVGVAGISSCVAQVAPQRIRVSSGVASGLLESKVDPVYPPLARQARIQGTVILKVHISKAGDVEDVQLVSGHPMLAPAAIEAVKQWKYRPYLLNGQPIEVETQIQVNFTLSDSPAPATGVVGDQPESETPAQPAASAETDVSARPPKTVDDIPRRVRISSGVAQGLLIKKVNPVYPADARNAGIQGNVLFQVGIDEQGNVDKIELVSGEPSLASAAMQVIKQWKYRPYLLNGKPLYVETQVQVTFTLR